VLGYWRFSSRENRRSGVVVVLLEAVKCWSIGTDDGQSCFGCDEASTDNSW
jgi:hypothetical protein